MAQENRERESGVCPGKRSRTTPAWMTPNVLLLGLVSLCNDTASEMIMPLLPYFLTSTLGAGALAVGFIEGLADATASVLKILSGRWSDRLGRQRPLVVAGYAVSSGLRPFLAAAMAPWHVLSLRMADRVGKGLRTSPRDALLAASVRPAARATAFGLHRAMDHAGAVLGPLLAAGFLAWVAPDLRLLFLLSALPSVAAVLVVALLVREAGTCGAEAQDRTQDTARAKGSPPSGHQLLRFLLPLGIFTLGNSSDLFLLLKAGGTRVPLTSLPLLWMGFHMVKMGASIPGGWLADRIGRRRVVGAGWLFYGVVYVGFALAESQALIWGLFLIYGLYHGLTEGAERALIAEMAPQSQRGAAFGWYHGSLGFLTLAASLLFGTLWELQGNQVAFLTSAALAALAVIALRLLGPPGRLDPTSPGASPVDNGQTVHALPASLPRSRKI